MWHHRPAPGRRGGLAPASSACGARPPRTGAPSARAVAVAVALVLASGLAGAAAGVNKFLTSGVTHNCPVGWDDIPPPQFAVFTVVREEQPYIEEFVMYHLFIGVDIIYIYGAAWWLGWGGPVGGWRATHPLFRPLSKANPLCRTTGPPMCASSSRSPSAT
jgi:hypothetical protein